MNRPPVPLLWDLRYLDVLLMHEFMFDVPCGTKISALSSRSPPMHPPQAMFPFFRGLHCVPGCSPAYSNSEQIKNHRNRLLSKMEICMNLRNAQNREIFKKKIVYIHNCVLTPPPAKQLSALGSVSCGPRLFLSSGLVILMVCSLFSYAGK